MSVVESAMHELTVNVNCNWLSVYWKSTFNGHYTFIYLFQSIADLFIAPKTDRLGNNIILVYKQCMAKEREEKRRAGRQRDFNANLWDSGGSESSEGVGGSVTTVRPSK